MWSRSDMWAVCHDNFVEWSPKDGETRRFSDHRPVHIRRCGEVSGGSVDNWVFPDWTLAHPQVCIAVRSIIIAAAPRGWEAVQCLLRKCMDVLWRIVRFYKVKRQVTECNVTREKKSQVKPIGKATTRLLTAMLRDPKQGTVDLGAVHNHVTSLYEDELCDDHRVFGDTGFRLSQEDVRCSVESIKAGKAPGPSGITGRFLQVFCSEAVPILTEEFNRWLIGAQPSKWWKRSWIRMIPKRGDLTKVANWRGICLLNEEWKVFSRAVKLQLETRIVLHPSQVGFVKQRWIQEHILVVQAGLQSDTVKGGWILLDFKNAYPSLRWDWLEKEMFRRGGQQCVFLTRLLVGGEARVCVGDKMGGWFDMKRGVKQGDVIAPLLFNVGLDPILHAMDELKVGLSTLSRTTLPRE